MSVVAPAAAFEGRISLPVAISCLYVRNARRGYIVYRYTPRWAYYDAAAGGLCRAEPQLDYVFGLMLSAAQARHQGLGRGPVGVDLPGLLGVIQAHPAMRAAVECAIDNHARQLDADTRRKNGIGGLMPDEWL